jgi:hypothetical protein
MLAARTDTQLLVVGYGAAICDARLTAERLNAFLGGGLDVAKMTDAVDPRLHRNRGSGGST